MRIGWTGETIVTNTNNDVREIIRSSSRRHATVCDPVPESQLKGNHGQDSDVDSGIVTCSKPGDRIGSTSSTDTDSSVQDLKPKTADCCCSSEKGGNILQGNNAVVLCSAKRTDCSFSNGKTLEGSAFSRQYDRRPPTPLSVFGGTHQGVRFDDQLPLSEQSIRRSCRQLFATLYEQRFTNAQEHENNPITTGAGAPRKRSKTMSDLDMKKSASTAHSRRKMLLPLNKGEENFINDTKAARAVREKQFYSFRRSNKVEGSLRSHDSPLSGTVRSISKGEFLLGSSEDSGIDGCRCSCKHGIQSTVGCSSQSSESSSSSTHSTNYHLCCHRHHHCCLSSEIQSSNAIDCQKSQLFKSNSCSKLSNLLLQGERHSCEPSNNFSTSKPATSMHKTPSCSSIASNSHNFHVTNVPVYNDSMMHVYAQVASVVPENALYTEIRRTPSQRGGTQENYYATVRSPPVTVNSYPHKTCDVDTILCKRPENMRPTVVSSNWNPHNTSSEQDMAFLRPSLAVFKQASKTDRPQSTLTSFRQQRLQWNSCDYVATPTTGVASSCHNSKNQNFILKSALKCSSTSSHNDGSISLKSKKSTSSSDNSKTENAVEVEYAVVDKSKKSRFASLPALNQFGSSNNGLDDEREPPVPPKRDLHKSDFALHRSRSTSPKKRLVEKFQGFAKSAKHAFQKAFSTERIYRPEREERLEATGQKLQKCKSSLISSIRASMSRKRKKAKPEIAEVVPQASSDPIWDEQPNSPLHVRGQLLQLNLDGSQVVELSKPSNKPYGFFVARGRVRNSRGVFVSRMRDQETQKQLAGLLDIGDEILEIEGLSVKESDIMEVNDMMAKKNTLLLTVLPYICRKDI